MYERGFLFNQTFKDKVSPYSVWWIILLLCGDKLKYTVSAEWSPTGPREENTYRTHDGRPRPTSQCNTGQVLTSKMYTESVLQMCIQMVDPTSQCNTGQMTTSHAHSVIQEYTYVHTNGRPHLTPEMYSLQYYIGPVYTSQMYYYVRRIEYDSLYL